MTPAVEISLIGLLLTAGVTIIGVVIWLIRLEGRVNSVSSKVVDLVASHALLDTKAEERAAANQKLALEVAKLSERIAHVVDQNDKLFAMLSDVVRSTPTTRTPPRRRPSGD